MQVSACDLLTQARAHLRTCENQDNHSHQGVAALQLGLWPRQNGETTDECEQHCSHHACPVHKVPIRPAITWSGVAQIQPLLERFEMTKPRRQQREGSKEEPRETHASHMKDDAPIHIDLWGGANGVNSSTGVFGAHLLPC